MTAATAASLLGEAGREGDGLLEITSGRGKITVDMQKPRTIDCKSGKAVGHSHCRQGTSGPDRTP